MPKDWASHKAEVEQLYIEQGRTLKEVRDILKDRHGFSASVRAYRMRIDDWDLRKYRSRKERSVSSTCSTTSPGLTGSSASPQSMKSQGQSSTMELNGDNMQFGPYSIPTAPMKPEDILFLVQGSSANTYLVEILISKWQRGGEYLDTLSAYLQRLDTFEGLIRTANDGKPTLFKLIEQHVPINEQLAVGKLILERQFSVHRKLNGDDAQWLKVWTIACRCTEWEEAKETLNESGRVEWLAGSLFLGCAQVVIAEQLLRKYIKHFRGLKDLDGRYSMVALPKAEACRKKYLNILDDLKSIGDTPLRPLFYKHSLEIIEAQIGSVDSSKDPRCVEHAEACREKYLKLTNGPITGCAQSDVVDDFLRDIEERDWLEISASHTPSPEQSRSPHGSDAGSDRYMSSSVPTYLPSIPQSSKSVDWLSNQLEDDDIMEYTPSAPASQNIVEVVMSRWKSLKGFSTYVHSLLLRDGSNVFIFDAAPYGNSNLFDMILSQTPKSDQIVLTKSILIAFSTINVDRCWRPSTLIWWLSLFSSQSWPDFQAKLDPEKVRIHLERVMSSSAVELLVNATVLLVGERLLLKLKNRMIENPFKSASRDDRELARYHRNFREYHAILGELQSRGLHVDPAWRTHGLNTM
ncbi:hypothetical protein BGZ60DRAFT_528013 [Tricladium varicosporioides]|nr:hypothetical protein BGZ60DRAFT_528013 [Hymenoscyphus varicosporioides]